MLHHSSYSALLYCLSSTRPQDTWIPLFEAATHSQVKGSNPLFSRESHELRFVDANFQPTHFTVDCKTPSAMFINIFKSWWKPWQTLPTLPSLYHRSENDQYLRLFSCMWLSTLQNRLSSVQRLDPNDLHVEKQTDSTWIHGKSDRNFPSQDTHFYPVQNVIRADLTN